MEERIDHRSYAARGLDEQPAIHEVSLRQMECRGYLVDHADSLYRI